MSILEELQQRTHAAKEREYQKFLERVQAQVDAAIEACRKAADDGKTYIEFACAPANSITKSLIDGLKKEGLAVKVMPSSHHSTGNYIIISWAE